MQKQETPKEVIVIIKKPGEPFELKSMIPTVKELLSLVGDITTVSINANLKLIYNTKLREGNVNCIVAGTEYRGTVVFTNYREDEFLDVSLNEFLALTRLPDNANRNSNGSHA